MSGWITDLIQSRPGGIKLTLDFSGREMGDKKWKLENGKWANNA